MARRPAPALADETLAPRALRRGRTATRRRRITWHYAIPLVGYHLAAGLAFLPWFFSWTGVVLLFAVAVLASLVFFLIKFATWITTHFVLTSDRRASEIQKLVIARHLLSGDAA